MAYRPHVLVPAVLTIAALCLPARAAADAPAATADSIYDGTFHLLVAGQQADAERVLSEAVQAFDTDARLAFFQAACTRSRFDVRSAFPLFKRVVDLDPSGRYGQASARILLLDASRENPKPHFDALATLSNKYFDDPLLLWMVAVQCRSLHIPLEGIRYYGRLDKLFAAAGGTGPSLFHQTYANVLDDVKLYNEALTHRYLAVKLEPAPWSYDGLGNTLTSLRQWPEADDAYAKATSLAPADPHNWANWCGSLRDRGDWNGVIEKASKGLAAEPRSARLWNHRGDAEAHLGRYHNAIRCYIQSMNVAPTDRYAYEQAAVALERLGQPQDALVYRTRADALCPPRKPTTAPATTADVR